MTFRREVEEGLENAYGRDDFVQCRFFRGRLHSSYGVMEYKG